MITKFAGRTRFLLTTGLAAASLLPAQAFAQAADGNGVQEIVVTAQKREQRLQDVPIAVTAITSDTLAANRVTTVADLSGLAPNVTVRPAAGGSGIPSFSSRGITSYGVVPGSDKEFSIYLDGVYIGSSRASLFDLPDTERIEVLRGPQGTLFGRNSTTGAASITTRDPTGEPGFTQQFTMGNENEFRSRTSLSLPAWGPFSAYVSFVHDEHRGDIQNLDAGTVWNRPGTSAGQQTSQKWLGNKNQNTVFAAIKFDPGGAFKSTFKFDYGTNRYTSDGVALIGINGSSDVGGLLTNVILPTQPFPYPIDTSAKRPDAVHNGWVVPGRQKNYGFNLISTLDLSDNLSLKNTAAYRYAYERSSSQIDGLGGLTVTPATVAYLGGGAAGLAVLNSAFASLIGPQDIAVGDRLGIFPTQTEVSGKQWSDELQLNYTSRSLTLTAGVIYFHQQDYAGGPRGSGSSETNTPAFSYFSADGVVPLGDQQASYNKATSIAGYAQAELHITPQLDLVAGGRVTYDKKSGVFYSGGAGYVPPETPSTPTAYPFTYSKTKPTYSIGLNYKPSQDLLVYAKYSTGFVSGGSIGGFSFKQETVRSAEGGVKAELLDRHLIANLAVWYADYHDIQSAQGGYNVGAPYLGTVVVDLGNEKAHGFEVETTVVPLRGLTLNGSLGYTHAAYNSVTPILSASAFGLPLNVTLNPKWTANLSGQYETQPLIGDATFMLRVDANWRNRVATLPGKGEEQLIPAFAPIAAQPARWIVNGRMGLQNLGPAHLDITLWARNITNNRDTLFPLTFINYVAASDFEPARTYGLDIGVRF